MGGISFCWSRGVLLCEVSDSASSCVAASQSRAPVFATTFLRPPKRATRRREHEPSPRSSSPSAPRSGGCVCHPEPFDKLVRLRSPQVRAGNVDGSVSYCSRCDLSTRLEMTAAKYPSAYSMITILRVDRGLRTAGRGRARSARPTFGNVSEFVNQTTKWTIQETGGFRPLPHHRRVLMIVFVIPSPVEGSVSHCSR